MSPDLVCVKCVCVGGRQQDDGSKSKAEFLSRADVLGGFFFFFLVFNEDTWLG